MAGPIALVGSGEFTDAMTAIDADLLAASGAGASPRVAIVPTASWPDGERVFERWAADGVRHFEALGAVATPVRIRTRADADDEAHVATIGGADLVYLSGGKPDHLAAVFDGTPAWTAVRAVHDRGGVVAGCSAGAMALAGRQFAFRRGKIPFPLRWEGSLGIVPGVAVIPHYDAFPEPIALALVLQAPPDVTVLGIDEGTALVGRDGTWQVRGRGRVTVWRGRERVRRGEGSVVRL